jgi:hypothetical protein
MKRSRTIKRVREVLARYEARELVTAEKELEELKERIVQIKRHMAVRKKEALYEKEISRLQTLVYAKKPVIVFIGDESVPSAVRRIDKYRHFNVHFDINGCAQTSYDPSGDIEFYALESLDNIDIDLTEDSFPVAAFAKDIVAEVARVLDSDTLVAMLPAHPRLRAVHYHNTPMRSNFTVTATVDVFILNTILTANPLVKTLHLADVKMITKIHVLSPERALVQFDTGDYYAPNCGLALVDLATHKTIWRHVHKGEGMYPTSFGRIFRDFDDLDAFKIVRTPRSCIDAVITDVTTPDVLAKSEVVLSGSNISKVLVLPDGWVVAYKFKPEREGLCSLTATRHMATGPRVFVTTHIPEWDSSSRMSVFVTPDGQTKILFRRAVDDKWCMVNPLCGATTREEVDIEVTPLSFCNRPKERAELVASRHSPYILLYEIRIRTGRIKVMNGLGGDIVREITTPPFTTLSQPFGDTCLLGHNNTVFQINIAPPK